METRGTTITVLRNVLNKLNELCNGKRYLYEEQTGIRLGSQFQLRTLDSNNRIIRTELTLTELQWSTAVLIVAAVGDRVYPPSSHSHQQRKLAPEEKSETGDSGGLVGIDDTENRWTVTAVTFSNGVDADSTLEYSVTPLNNNSNFYSEANHAFWDWNMDGTIVVQKNEIIRDKIGRTKDACEEVVKPVTKDQKISYIDYLLLPSSLNTTTNKNSSNGEHNVVGNATKFVSHAWKYNFNEVVETLEDSLTKNLNSNSIVDSHSNDTSEYLWFDILVVNQHMSDIRDFTWWKTEFQEAIHEIGTVLLVLAPWEKPIPLTRSWCLWEIFSAAHTDSTLQVVMSKDQEARFLAHLRMDFGEINQSIESLDMKNAEAGNPKDKRMIQEAVEHSELGFDRINQICQHQVENSLIQFAKNALTRDGVDYHLMHMFAIILNERKKYQDAIYVSTLDIDTRKKILGKTHVRTFQSMVDHVFYLKNAGNVNDAEVMYQHVLSEAGVLLQKPNYHSSLIPSLRRYLNDSGRLHEANELSQRYKMVIPGPSCQIH